MSTVSTIESLFATLLAGDTSVIPVLEDAILEGVSGAGKSVYMLIERKGYKRGSHVVPTSKVEARYAVVTPGKSIRLVGLAYPGDPRGEQRPYDRTFVIGETAAYDSFNMTYCGTIKSIGAGGNVTVQKDHGRTRCARLDAEHFTWRNYKLDLAAIAQRNSDVMMAS